MVNKLVIQNLRHRPVRTLLGILAIGVEVTMVLTLIGVTNGTLSENKRQKNGVGADIWVRPPGATAIGMSNAGMKYKMIEYFEKQPHIAAATGSISQPLGTSLDSVQGIEVEKFAKLSGSFCCVEGKVFQAPDDIVIDTRWAEQKKAKVGDSMVALNRTWRISGIVETGKLGRLFLPLNLLQDLTGNPDKVSQIYLKVDDKANIKAAVAHLKNDPLLQGYSILDTEELLSQLTVDNFPMIKPFIGVVIGISVIVGFLVVFLSMYMAVLERTREIGILKSMGATPWFILSILLRETAMLAILGSVLGIGLSYVSRSAVTLYGGTFLVQEIAYDWWMKATVISLVGALLGTLYPAWKAVRQDALEALAYD